MWQLPTTHKHANKHTSTQQHKTVSHNCFPRLSFPTLPMMAALIPLQGMRLLTSVTACLTAYWPCHHHTVLSLSIQHITRPNDVPNPFTKHTTDLHTQSPNTPRTFSGQAPHVPNAISQTTTHRLARAEHDGQNSSNQDQHDNPG